MKLVFNIFLNIKMKSKTFHLLAIKMLFFFVNTDYEEKIFRYG